MIRELDIWGTMKAVILENEEIEVIILPDKGSEIFRYRDKRTAIDYLHVYQEEIERYLQDAEQGVPSLLGDYFFGGCYTMFPNAGIDQTYENGYYDYHGDLRKAAWDYAIDGCTLKLKAGSRHVPLGIERTVHLEKEGTRLTFTDRLYYDSNRQESGAIPYIYGIHPYHSSPLLDENTRCIVGGETVDVLPARQQTMRKLEFYRVEDEGMIEVRNPGLPRSIQIRFDKEFMNYVWVWHDHDETGTPYVTSLIPCTVNGHDGIAGAVANHSIRFMKPGEELITSWSIELHT
ncbi:hypothetical protein M6D81_12890 [Paenibacillus sp. J5C_2022]|uniref:hypothetical protein n=1 Tax=Paenibacillus sp. J5C2022 TaxID=2977129 RepID=UPI0021D38D3F|nr:hypothetical protein [Paenibacillus sp. J5C2022]MCU6709598.1 hypothetical protein [Paenibacillus sp. J5C2022]